MSYREAIVRSVERRQSRRSSVYKRILLDISIIGRRYTIVILPIAQSITKRVGAMPRGRFLRRLRILCSFALAITATCITRFENSKGDTKRNARR
jgi:hypothetical protein